MDDVAEQGAVAVIKQAAKDGRPGDEVGLGLLCGCQGRLPTPGLQTATSGLA